MAVEAERKILHRLLFVHALLYFVQFEKIISRIVVVQMCLHVWSQRDVLLHRWLG